MILILSFFSGQQIRRKIYFGGQRSNLAAKVTKGHLKVIFGFFLGLTLFFGILRGEYPFENSVWGSKMAKMDFLIF